MLRLFQFGKHVEPLIGTCERCADVRIPLFRYMKQLLCERCLAIVKRVNVGIQQKKRNDDEDNFMRNVINTAGS